MAAPSTCSCFYHYHYCRWYLPPFHRGHGYQVGATARFPRPGIPPYCRRMHQVEGMSVATRGSRIPLVAAVLSDPTIVSKKIRDVTQLLHVVTVSSTAPINCMVRTLMQKCGASRSVTISDLRGVALQDRARKVQANTGGFVDTPVVKIMTIAASVAMAIVLDRGRLEHPGQPDSRDRMPASPLYGADITDYSLCRGRWGNCRRRRQGGSRPHGRSGYRDILLVVCEILI